MRPEPGRALVVSNNPFLEYQRKITATFLFQCGIQHMEVSCMGPASDLDHHEPAVKLGLLLDAFGGTLFWAQKSLTLVAAGS